MKIDSTKAVTHLLNTEQVSERMLSAVLSEYSLPDLHRLVRAATRLAILAQTEIDTQERSPIDTPRWVEAN